MSQHEEFDVLAGFDRDAQRQWMQSLRPRTASIELVFLDGDTNHPLTGALAWLTPIRQVGVGERPGYQRPQSAAVLHRYPYDRTILQALDGLGGLFEHIPSPSGDRVQFTTLGNVDVSFLDRSGAIIGSTVTHEGLILMRQGDTPSQ
ncbi:hypothetical protein [Arthrobacter sp. NPDC089319]|uniref:hypothetical protein n=1 Tax=Arthrobacter sp. NPDC089319 TaxID=3155915 RepID=UPI0034306E44